MMINELRKIIRLLIAEATSDDLLGEPDSSAEKHRDEPQPQYDVEEDGDQDEASTVGGMGAGLGPAMPLSYDPEKPVYDPYRRKKKK
jgi:hypothetical protein